jgi:hypothetical protein
MRLHTGKTGAAALIFMWQLFADLLYPVHTNIVCNTVFDIVL